MSDLQIKILSTDGLDAVVPMLAASAYKPLRYLLKELGADLTDFWSRSIAELLQAQTAQGFLAVRGGAQLGLLIYSNNPWESNLLGKKAAVINTFVVDGSIANREQVAQSMLDHMLQNAAANGVQFILSKTYTNELYAIHALESRGFLLMDTIVDCYYDYRRVPFERLPRPVLADGVTLRLATSADRDELVAVVELAFREHFGRFHADERIGSQLATQAYKQWMCSSLDGYADWIHLVLVAGKIVGFSIWKRQSKAESQLKVRFGHYSIAGIHPDYHGQGLFTALTYAGMQSLHGIADIIEGPTHINNYGVQLGYSKLGWRVCSDARHSFHKWMD
jgi:ribosomal protein S18 acetylase RimI-like enzyme